MSPAYGGWGGRYVWRQPSGETRPFWTQGGDSYPGNDSSRDTVTASTGQTYTSDQATIWRWRTAFQNDFAARMDWTIKDVSEANHNPRVVVNGRPGTEPLVLDAQVGTPVTLDAGGHHRPRRRRVDVHLVLLPGGRAPGFRASRCSCGGDRPLGAGSPGQGGIPSAPAGGPREPPPRVVIENANGPRATVVPKQAGIAHVILAVEDDGTPSLTSYRRVVLKMKPAGETGPTRP